MRRPEELFEDPYGSGMKFPWLRTRRHWIPYLNGGDGGYLTCAGDDQCLVEIYSNPQEYGFDFPADANLAKARFNNGNVVEGLIEEWFHLVKVPKTKGEGYYTRRERCKGRHCEHCKTKTPKIFGSRFYYAFSWATWRFVIEPVMEQVERYCRCGGYKVPLHYVCPACREVVQDMTGSCPYCQSDNIHIDAETHMASCSDCQGEPWALLESMDKDLAKIVGNQMKCPHCDHEDYPELVLECSTEGCTEESHDIFDCQITLAKESDDNNAHIKLVGWELKDFDQRSFNPEYQGGGETGEKIAQRNMDRVPLLEIDDFKIDPPHVQAKTLGKPNPFTEGGSADGPAYGEYDSNSNMTEFEAPST